MRKEAYYFPHDSNAQDDPKCMILIDQLGMEGYGIFWAIIEKLRNESDYKLPLSVCGSFAKRWGTSKEKVEAVVKTYGLFCIEDDKFFSIRLTNSMIFKSSKGKKGAEARWGNANALQTHKNALQIDATAMQNDASIEKNSIEKNSIVQDSDIPIEKCLEIALKDERWTRSNKTDALELKHFNYYLERLGVYNKIPIDYKSHFSRLKKKNPSLLTEVYTIEELRNLAKQLDNDTSK